MISEAFRVTPVQPPPHADSLVCVVDDDESVRRGLERLFRSSRFTVESFATAAAYLGREAHPGPVCLVVDVRMPGLDGFELQGLLAGHREQIVFLTGHGDVAMCAKAMKAGAADFLTKPVSAEELLAAVTRALALAREISADHACQAAARARLEFLTPREFEVMEHVVAGRLNKQIAAELGIAEKTVKIHRGRVMKKTHSISVPDLVRLVQKAGVTNQPAHPLREV